VDTKFESVDASSSDRAVDYRGLTGVADGTTPHLGGNMAQGDPYTYSPRVWDYLLRRFAVSSVLDLGSGIGNAADYFHRSGARVIAVDGSKSNCSAAVFPTLHVDLTQGSVYCEVDLVHCQEVVEHIEAIHIDFLLKSLCCGKFIVMTNALPGQGGFHHVNEQSTEYWIDQLKRYSCEVLVEDTRRVRRLAELDGAVYLARTGLVLSNRYRLA
jgi:SAM-dependent methyltransferase